MILQRIGIKRCISSVRFWYCFLGLGLVGLHLILSWRIVGHSDQFIISVIFWLSLLMLLKQHQAVLVPQSEWFANALGAILIALICLKGASVFATESAFVRVFPGLAMLGLALLVSGFRFRCYWRESLLLLTFMLPTGLANQLLGRLMGEQLQIGVAQFATFVLHYVGCSVARQGITIGLPEGAVSVEYGCAGGNLAILLWQLAVPLLLLFPISRFQQCLVPLVAFAMTFVLSGIRVVIMALVVSNPEAFQYWHGHAGGQIFSTLAIGCFSLYSWQLTEIPEALTVK